MKVRNARKTIAAALIVAGAALLGTGCGSSSSGGGDEPAGNIAGTWRGLFTSDSYGGVLILNLNQTGSRFTGTYNVNYEDSGTISGDMNGNSFDFELGLPAYCPGDISGSGSINGNSMTLRFSGYDCETTFNNGYAEMARD